MRLAFELGINALEAFLILYFLARYLGYQEEGQRNYWGSAIIWLVSIASIRYFSGNCVYEHYSTIIQMLINFMFCIWLLRGSFLQKVCLSVFVMGCVMLVSIFTTLLFSKMLEYQMADLLKHTGSKHIISVLTSKIIFLELIQIIFIIKKKSRLNSQEFFPFLVLPFLTIGIIALMMYSTLHAIEIQNEVFYMAIFLICILIVLTYFLFDQLVRSAKLKLDYELLNLQYQCEKKNAKHVRQLYEQIRGLRHDMKNHLLCISLMAEQKKVADIHDYVNQLLQQHAEANRIFIFSGNDVLDAILNTKLSEAQQKQMQFNTMIADSLDFISHEDICSLLGNVIDNALAAAANTEERYVSLQIQPQGAYMDIIISNSICGSVLKNNPNLRTTKQQQSHGYGIKNIRKIVEKYSGMLDFYESENRFFCEILLPTVQSRNNTVLSMNKLLQLK